MSLRDGLYFYYPLDEGSGSVAHDVSGNGNHGTIANGAWGTGRVGNGCLTFNGSNTTLTPAYPALTSFPSFSIAFWAQVTALGGGGGFYDSASHGIGCTYSRYWSNGLIWSGFHGQGAVYPVGITTMGDLGWHHLVWTVDASSNEVLYTDGYALATGGNGAALLTNFYFGSDDSGVFNGNMDEPAIWNRVLDPSEVAQLYNSGRGNPFPFFTPQLLDRKLPGKSSLLTNRFSLSAALLASSGLTLTGAYGSFTETGEAVTFNLGLPVANGSFVETGEPAPLKVGLTCAFGGFTETGEATLFTQTLASAFGSFVLTGEGATLLLGGNISMPASAGSFAATFENAALNTALTAAFGSIAETGEPVTFLLGYGMAANTGSFALTPQVTTFNTTINVANGSFSETGEPATLAVVRYAEKVYAFIII